MNVSVNNSVGNYVVTLLSPLWRIITMELIMSQTRTIEMSNLIMEILLYLNLCKHIHTRRNFGMKNVNFLIFGQFDKILILIYLK